MGVADLLVAARDYFGSKTRCLICMKATTKYAVKVGLQSDSLQSFTFACMLSLRKAKRSILLINTQRLTLNLPLGYESS